MKRNLARASSILLLLLVLAMQYGPPVAALSDAQLKIFQQGINYYDIATSCSASPAAATTGAPGTGTPDGTTFPNLDPTAMAKAVDDYISKTQSGSPLKNLGATIVASAQNSNISPFLLVAIANNETSLGTAGTPQVTEGNDLFNRRAAPDQAHISIPTGIWYKWSSVKASVDYTAPENQNVKGGGDIASYLRYQFASSLNSDDLVTFSGAYDAPSQAQQYADSLKPSIEAMAQDAQSNGGSTPATASATTGVGSTTGSESAVTIDDSAAQQAAQQASTGNTKVGYALYDSSGNEVANYNDTSENYGASITKAMILVAYLNQIGSGSMSASAKAHVTAMIEQSSDDDAKAVLSLLNNPQAQITRVAQDAGMTGFKFNITGDSLYWLGQSQITANDFAKFFSKIDTMFPATQKDFALGLLSNITPQAGLLQAGLPGTVYSKEGWKPEPGGGSDPALSGSPNPFGDEGAPWVVNQAAQFTSNGTTYGLAVTVAGANSETDGESIIQSVGSAIATAVNNASTSSSSGSGCSCTSNPSTDTTALTGGSNKEKIFNYFVGQGLTPAQAAGIDGNFGQESGYDPTEAPGYLAQWTDLGPLTAFAQQEGKPITDLGVQLDFIWHQLNTDYSSVLSNIQKATTAEDAANAFVGPEIYPTGAPADPTYEGQRQGGYENPGDPVMTNRIAYANQILTEFGGGAAAGGPESGVSGAGGCAGAVNCSNPSTDTAGLSTTRQGIVCLAEQELQLWDSGQMTPGFRANSQDSFSKYSQNSDELWCADFASWIYNQAGDPLQSGSDWRVSYVPNIQSIGEQNQSFHWHPVNSSYTPQPGDLAIHGSSHVNIVDKYQNGQLTLIGGDQDAGSGGYPDDSKVSEYTPSGTEDITGWVSPD